MSKREKLLSAFARVVDETLASDNPNPERLALLVAVDGVLSVGRELHELREVADTLVAEVQDIRGAFAGAAAAAHEQAGGETLIDATVTGGPDGSH